MKLKLLPSLKERKRYLVYEIISEKSLTKEIVCKTLKAQIFKFIGELGVARAGIKVLPDTYNNQKGVIRVGHKYVDEIKSALIMTTNINKNKVIIKNIGVSGTIKKAKLIAS